MKKILARVFGMHLAMIVGACLIVLTIPAYRLLDAERSQVGAVPRAIDRQGDKVTAAVLGWMSANVTPVMNRTSDAVDGLPAMARDLIDKHATRIEDQAAATGEQVLARVDTGMRMVDTRTGEALATVNDFHKDLGPVLEQASLIERHTDKAITDLHPQVLGLVAASKVTMGQTATTMREVERATPKLLETIQEIGDKTDDAMEAAAAASEATAKTMANFAESTKPMPRSVRLGLQIAGPLSQIASYVIIMLATLGIL